MPPYKQPANERKDGQTSVDPESEATQILDSLGCTWTLWEGLREKGDNMWSSWLHWV